MKKLTTDQFILRSNVVHQDKYDYSNVEYINNSTKVHISCILHGIFDQRPSDHMRGDGCPACGHERTAASKRGDSVNFINRANQIHNDLYDYSQVIYSNAITKVNIVCKIHGVFKQTPDKHLGGTGCPKCSTGISRGERKIQVLLDNMNIVYEREKRFPGLVGATSNSRLRYDFWLPDYKTLIEYDGEQHFSPINIKGRLDSSDIILKYQATIVNDVKKDEYAKNMGYRLIRIPYTDFNKIDIEYFNNLALVQ